MGLEPTTSRITIWRSNRLNYTHHNVKPLVEMVRLRGFEPLAHGLEGRCSIRLSYRRSMFFTKKNGAGEGNRTLATSLEG